jgi:hypothetical protein
MASMGRSTVDPICRGDGIYGEKWHLWDAPPRMRSVVGMASMERDGIYETVTLEAVCHADGIYGQKWHLWQLTPGWWTLRRPAAKHTHAPPRV